MSVAMSPSLSPNLVLDEHQKEGVRWMAKRSNFLLADEMGLGKTIQIMVLLALTYDRGHGRRFMVACPLGLKTNWRDEIADKMVGVDVTVLNGTATKRSKMLAEFKANQQGCQVLIVNYEQIKVHLEEINDLGIHIVVADECHALKDPTTQRAKAFLKVKARQFYMLSGSPMLNNVHELWTILHRIDPEEYPNYYKFRHRYCVMGGFQAKQVVGVKNERELQRTLQNVMIRRLRKDVYPNLEKVYLPPEMLDMEEEQRKLYEQVRDELLLEIPGNPDPMEIENAMVMMLRLKQICGTPATIPGHLDVSPKLDRAVAKAVEFGDNGRRSVFFTQFRGVQACLMDRMCKAGLQPFQMNGDTPAMSRKDMVDMWAEYPTPQPFVVMLQVGGVGLNMVAAADAVFLDKLWVPKLNEQAEDRLCRRGQSEPVMIHTLAMRRSVEQYIEQLLNRKNKLFQKIVEEGNWKRKLLEMLRDDEDPT